ncbi:electron transport complex protein RnfC [Thermanaerosceptrum fracticalcis]|uniref:Electron transport complex protein RnfC n=1 Tax=Thermanaerosceptrum fracticalcis TaxID=1712410 RepID=A0A7G6E7F9_THEFR|nr:4Fe-4S dicluster domain-containing protein [Thermanaerosceptrum fracticalcis]QNB48013.1 electron transport complex protein RnfC [Thermanaerosceptrum fracticalcis]
MTDLLAQVKEAGVVGAGGAGFPTHIKLNARVEYVLVNGAECEPLLRANQQMLAKYAQELWQALRLVVEHTGARKGIIALKIKYEQARAALESCQPREGVYGIHLLDDFYPAGDEHVLVHEVTGRIVPEGGIPLKVGCVVINVETLLNVLGAVRGVPVTHKFVTVTGAVRKPLTASVPLGTRISALLELAGGSLIEKYGIIEGGPMMGKAVAAGDVVTKTTGGVIVLPVHHPLLQHKNESVRLNILRARAACCQCRICTDLCPRYLLGHGLEPHKIMRALGAGSLTKELTQAFLCSECGACDKFACPMGLSPRQLNSMLKQEMGKAGIRNPHGRNELKPEASRGWHKIPSNRLIARLGLEAYNVPAPLLEIEVNPQEVILPLQQHLGQPARPVVQAGEKVDRGQLIGTIPDHNAVGANLHASIRGIVESVTSSITIKRL